MEGASWDFASKMEEIMSLVKQMQNAGNLDPRIENLVTRINELQQAKNIMKEELCEANEHNAALQKELEKLNEEELKLEEILNEKKAIRQNMERHSEEREAEMKRQQEMNLESKERIDYLEAKIQEEKLKQRKQRMQFEQRLEELMEKHKSLWECHVRKKPVTEEDKELLLAEEKRIQEKLAYLQDELDLLRCFPFSEERRFLKSPEASCAMELFQEENKKAKEYLEANSKKNSDLQERCRRLKAELENLGVLVGGRKTNRLEEGRLTGPQGRLTGFWAS
ncbi:synaptonemal complex central element protein 1-like [Sphaerodactylus townsendi]|uniref:synaptonemal complex central element protein 1-like n=1 Tax=Sphaerodactylus townsendi TaxID=933632 RepID=UPI0020275BDA|nr:synaptonemal complex central element protein 1-like [Sphaerodactylus townsendi]